MLYRSHDVLGRCVMSAHQLRQAVVTIARRAQRRQAGHADTGRLRRLPERALPTGVVLPVTLVTVARRIVRSLAREHCRRGTRNLFAVHGGREVNVGYRDAFVGRDVTYRGIGADGMRVQQTEEEQAQAHHAPQNRCRAAPLRTGGRPGCNHAVILTRPRNHSHFERREHCVNKPSCGCGCPPEEPTACTPTALDQLQTTVSASYGPSCAASGRPCSSPSSTTPPASRSPPERCTRCGASASARSSPPR